MPQSEMPTRVADAQEGRSQEVPEVPSATQRQKKAMMTPQFRVWTDESGYFSVSSGERYQDKLDAGECLTLIAHILIAKEHPQKLLKTEAEHEAYEFSLGLGVPRTITLSQGE